VIIIKNNSDRRGNAYGCHESYDARERPLDLAGGVWRTCLHPLALALILLLVVAAARSRPSSRSWSRRSSPAWPTGSGRCRSWAPRLPRAGEGARGADRLAGRGRPRPGLGLAGAGLAPDPARRGHDLRPHREARPVPRHLPPCSPSSPRGPRSPARGSSAPTAATSSRRARARWPWTWPRSSAARAGHGRRQGAVLPEAPPLAALPQAAAPPRRRREPRRGERGAQAGHDGARPRGDRGPARWTPLAARLELRGGGVGALRATSADPTLRAVVARDRLTHAAGSPALAVQRLYLEAVSRARARADRPARAPWRDAASRAGARRSTGSSATRAPSTESSTGRSSCASSRAGAPRTPLPTARPIGPGPTSRRPGAA